ncbi:MAG TPA: sulfatase-like hydrolase/transferase [Polyangiaceae bacterium]|nr:sulfatase-like hydrolase/transferase [Polyangiaceae bacterium]
MPKLATSRLLARAVLAAWAVVAAELAIVLVFSRSRLASVWEVQFGLLWLLPTALLAGTAGGLLGAALLFAFRHVERRAFRWGLALGVGGLAGWSAWSVSFGRHFDAWPVRVGFIAASGALAAAAVFATSPRLRRLAEARPRAWLGGICAAIVAVELANALVLVRLYPGFHLSLAGAALLLAPLLLVVLPWPAGKPRAASTGSARRGLVLPLVAAGLVVGSALAAGAASARLAHFDNFRLLLVDRAPIAGQLVRLSARLAPPSAGAAAACSDCEAQSAGTAGGPDLRGRDLLLITVDALRADHVGAYGYQRPTTPGLDALAAQSVRFEHAYAPTPHTSYSVTSLMTGKYLRPLLLQGAGEDSDTWASLLRTYGYKTAAFYPPAVFFIDGERFRAFRENSLGFEYEKVEFAEGERRVRQVAAFLEKQPADRNVFVWVHLFGPHEPYELHPGHPFGDRDVDRYDSEIAAADATIQRLIGLFEARPAPPVVIVTADHGEEFGEHGGRYHGTTVYEEQVRVPMLVHLPDRKQGRVVSEPVQTIDLLPTVLGALDIPRPPRMRGRDLGALLLSGGSGKGLAFAETEEQTLLAEGHHRLICERKIGACRLFDLKQDPRQLRDVAKEQRARFEELRSRVQALAASHGRYEAQGLRAEGGGLPPAILRGISGDGDAAPDIAALLDDADRSIRRKAAEVLFELEREETAPALRLALSRDEDLEVRQYCALALTRLGQGAPLSVELLRHESLHWRRLAALALAEQGDDRGEGILLAWWQDERARSYDRARQLLEAFAELRARAAVWPLTRSLGDVRLRPHIAAALARIGDPAARGPLVQALAEERYQSARVALAKALVELGAEGELARPLVRFLGVPDPIPGGVGFAVATGILQHVGGPSKRELKRLREQASLGAKVLVVVPSGGNGRGVRLLARARTRGDAPGQIRVGVPLNHFSYNSKGELKTRREVPKIDPSRSARLDVPVTAEPVEVFTLLPEAVGARAGRALHLVVFADRQVELDSIALVPLADEIPPPPPKPWKGAPPADPDGVLPASAQSGP